MGKYVKRIGSNSVLIVTNVQNSSRIAEQEMDLTRQFIKNKIIFQHMVRRGGQENISEYLYALTFRFTFWMIQICGRRKIIII